MLHDDVKDAFSDICGLPAWHVRKGVGSFLTLEYGHPFLMIREPRLSRSKSLEARRSADRRQVVVSGRWHLWIYMCNWTISSDLARLADNDASSDTINEATQYLDGQILLSVEVSPDDFRTIFRFDLGGELVTWPYQEERDRREEQWLLYDYGTKRVHTLKGDGTWLSDPLED
ncbi:hypothetical protein [Paraburkholderia dilworthii]